ncbi:MAG: SEC-C metal-binding domain-containing protein [Cyclobacteriaceae bacterium]|nr:SEC-C domain-containing protein [Cyclobacteriaceae bacterium]MCB0500684.1 SEC-C domain-containing protein [Cyclobacteriaceae bacterium]MCB9236557.1 SEC-C domain-containing protein [Flammeovirgaceae bacterium]MCO5273011.1 SEC-C metal-binding domain-containing protein [Cyclobacteriaceae bacterium]MCW5903222.1 SEC-C domain-containing protein [Cyclobacteriaceae bacterium]
MEKIGRNDPCHCGSGKKYKNCHMDNEASNRGMNKAFVITGILVALLAIGIIGYFNNANNNTGTQNQGFTPSAPPEGEAPPGKVWSYEHGHWHNAF